MKSCIVHTDYTLILSLFTLSFRPNHISSIRLFRAVWIVTIALKERWEMIAPKLAVLFLLLLLLLIQIYNTQSIASEPAVNSTDVDELVFAHVVRKKHMFFFYIQKKLPSYYNCQIEHTQKYFLFLVCINFWFTIFFFWIILYFVVEILKICRKNLIDKNTTKMIKKWSNSRSNDHCCVNSSPSYQKRNLHMMLNVNSSFNLFRFIDMANVHC